MIPAKLRRQLDRLAARPPAGPRRKRTTVETRQEFDKILAYIESQPHDAPTIDPLATAKARRELDAMIAELDKADEMEAGDDGHLLA